VTLGLGGAAVESRNRFKSSRTVIPNKIRTKQKRGEEEGKKKKKKSIAGIYRADFATRRGRNDQIDSRVK